MFSAIGCRHLLVGIFALDRPVTETSIFCPLSVHAGRHLVDAWRRPMKDPYGRMAVGMAWGIGIGGAIGAAMDNVPLWISVGTAIGAAVGATLSEGRR